MSGGEKPFVGWLLDARDRAELLGAILPRYETVVAHHVTLIYDPDRPDLPRETRGEVVGVADDGMGVQALVVQIGGGVERPDGSTFHITWSLGLERRAWESNAVLAKQGWAPLPTPILIRLHPMLFRPG
jgi:hypothetical protein